MKISIISQNIHEINLFIKDSFDTLMKKLRERGHEIDVRLLPDVVDNDMHDYDWVMVSLHRNERAKKFIRGLKCKMAYFEHDQFYPVDDISWAGNKFPDVVFYANKQHRIRAAPHQRKSKWVPVTWYKDEIDVEADRMKDSVLLIDDLGMSENARRMPHNIHQLPMSEICKELEEAGYTVTIKKPLESHVEYNGYIGTLPGAVGCVKGLKSHEFAVGYNTGMLNEAFLYGCIPMMVEHVKDDRIHLRKNLHNEMNMFDVRTTVASASREQTGILGIVTHMKCTRMFPVNDIFKKMDIIDRERCLHDLNKFWGPETTRPFSDVVIETFEDWKC